MRNYARFVLIMFLVSMIACATVQAADAQSEGKESEPAKSGSKEEPSNEDGVITNSIGMKLKLIKAGEFMMGSKESGNQEQPVHTVEITKPFYIGVYEVTQQQYQKIMGRNPSHFKDPNKPVDSVSWDDAVLFCKKLSEKEGVEYRLPTEAEWEYACRAGTTTKYYWGDEMDRRDVLYFGYINGEVKTDDVGTERPNAWGLFDMSGNVWEWCSDWYNRDYYRSSPSNNPRGPAEGKYRVLRGGSLITIAICRSANRSSLNPGLTSSHSGFRIARDAE